MSAKKTDPPDSPLTAEALTRFREGREARLHDLLGAHPEMDSDAESGTRFAVWAPGAKKVSVIGDFNDWDRSRAPLRRRRGTGIFEGRVPEAGAGDLYKFAVHARRRGGVADRADPFARATEEPPRTASRIPAGAHEWQDSEWMASRAGRTDRAAPIAIYEVHPGSWRRGPGGRFLTWRELAPQLIEHVCALGFTHVEFLPVMEHPFYGSWGYQCTAFFAPTARYGPPEDFAYLVDALHRAGVGVILDWVPSHFPADEHALARFDGTPLYEHPDPKRGYHPDWKSLVFDYGRPEVRSFLLSSALYWLEHYHADALRVDAVASMLYLDYSREEGEWEPNRLGGNENLEAVDFLQLLNETIYREFPDAHTIAEESTAWPGVSHPVYDGGLGFGFKWDMGWMNDTLAWFSRPVKERSAHHDELTFRALYAARENYVLPLSHDEVVYGKGTLLGRMRGSERERFADLRLLLGYMYTLPGKKLLFMGGELAPEAEWDHDAELPWELTAQPRHAGIAAWVAALNGVYRTEPALHRRDCEEGGLEWIEADDAERSVLSWIRAGGEGVDPVVVVANFSPREHRGYRVGVPHEGTWAELLSSEAARFGGSGSDAPVEYRAEPVPAGAFSRSLALDLPPRSIRILR